jgi:hypothetical protein
MEGATNNGKQQRILKIQGAPTCNLNVVGDALG